MKLTVLKLNGIISWKKLLHKGSLQWYVANSLTIRIIHLALTLCVHKLNNFAIAIIKWM